LRLEGSLETIHRKVGSPVDDVARAAHHAFDSARLEGVAVGADFLRSVFEEALKPPPDRIISGTSVQREK